MGYRRCRRLLRLLCRSRRRARRQPAKRRSRSPMPRFTSKAVREPLGVAGAIIPWNYPLLMAAWKVAPALAAGCTMVLKPSELTPLTALELGAIAEEAGLPAGRAQHRHRPRAGRRPAAHRPSRASTSSPSPARSRPARRSWRRPRATSSSVSLELGGKSPFVVFDDADIEKAVEWIMFGIFWNQGQVCSATSRVLVQDGTLRPASGPAGRGDAARSRSATGWTRARCSARSSRRRSTTRCSPRSTRRARPGRDGRGRRQRAERFQHRLLPRADRADRRAARQRRLARGDLRAGRLRRAPSPTRTRPSGSPTTAASASPPP